MKARDNQVQTLLWVYLFTRQMWRETFPLEWTAKYLGAHDVHSRLLFEGVPAHVDLLGEQNILYFGSGPIDELTVGSGCMSVVCKSPHGSA
jgi:aldehyde:ferredoxin oxidoreductase